ncbi:MAG TPA: efflux RND transporter periplasmic adaptor subunit, partial [Acidobacteriota bacterium]
MKLVKKEGSDEEAMKKMLEQNTQQQSLPPEGSSIFISPERRQTLGVRSVPAEYETMKREVRTVGKIAYDETRITHIHTKLSGWIERVYVNFVGEAVKRGQPLFTIYSPELVSTQEEYLLALKHQQNLGKSSFDWIAKGSGSLADSARERLKLWGVSENEIQQITKTGKARRTLTIYSPVTGVVTQRSAYHHGTYISPETELYTIVDLSTVWLIAEIYEKDLPFIKTGQQIRLEFPYATDKKQIESRIEFFYPYLDPETRTGQIRIQLQNPQNELKPDQFVNVFLSLQEQTQLVVPSDSVLNTGDRQYVFVDLGSGYFEPREVRIGVQGTEQISIAEGLQQG